MKKITAVLMSFIFFLGVFQAPLSIQGGERFVESESVEEEIPLEENEEAEEYEEEVPELEETPELEKIEESEDDFEEEVTENTEQKDEEILVEDDAKDLENPLEDENKIFLSAELRSVEYIYSVSDLKDIQSKLEERDEEGKPYEYRFKLMADLDLGDEIWTAIGTRSNPFFGQFDGNGHSISNLTLNPEDQDSGLFGWVERSVIENIHIKNVNITKSSSIAGGIVGYANYSHIRDSSVVGGKIKSTATNSHIGGITGYAKGSILERNMTHLIIEGNDYTGAILGGGYSSSIRDSYSLSTVYGIRPAFGTLNSSCTIENSYFAGNVSSGHIGLGGTANKNNYYNVDIQVGITNATDIPTGRTTEEMMEKSNYEDWDFENVWSLGDKNYPMPYLKQAPNKERTEISNVADLEKIRENPGGYFTLMADLDLGDEVWTAIGTRSNPFFGQFDGNGHSISNLTLNPEDQDSGLFGWVERSVIENIHIKNVNITKSSSMAGGIVGYASNSHIRDSSVVGGKIKSTVTNSHIGGITGYAKGSILERNMTHLIIEGNDYTGAILGGGYSSSIRDSYSLSTVYGIRPAFGTLNSSCTIENSYFAGNVSSGHIGLGGTANKNNYYNVDIQVGITNATDIPTGRTTDEMMEKSNYEDWDFENVWSLGDENYPMPYLKQAPNKERTEISNVADLERIRENPGGYFTLMADLDLGDEVWTAIGTRSNPFFGQFDGNGHSISNLTLNPEDQDSGLFGWVERSVIENIHIKNVNITKSSSMAGGIVGYASNSHIRDSSVVGGKIKSTVTNSHIGGITGYAKGSILERNMTHLIIEGNDYTGAILGGGYSSSIRDSYSLSTVYGIRPAFGTLNSSCTIENSYFAGNVSSGHIGLGGTANKNNYYNVDIQVGITNATDIPTGRTTEEMMEKSNYEDWDFENVWEIEEGVGYPRLRWKGNYDDSPIEKIFGVRGIVYEDATIKAIESINEMNQMLDVGKLSYENGKISYEFALRANNEIINLRGTTDIYKDVSPMGKSNENGVYGFDIPMKHLGGDWYLFHQL